MPMYNADLTINSSSGGVEVVTIAAGPVSTTGADQECRAAMVKPESGVTIYFNIGAVATSLHPVLDATFMPMPVSNTNLCNFFSSTAADTVYIIWRG